MEALEQWVFSSGPGPWPRWGPLGAEGVGSQQVRKEERRAHPGCCPSPGHALSPATPSVESLARKLGAAAACGLALTAARRRPRVPGIAFACSCRVWPFLPGSERGPGKVATGVPAPPPPRPCWTSEEREGMGERTHSKAGSLARSLGDVAPSPAAHGFLGLPPS